MARHLRLNIPNIPQHIIQRDNDRFASFLETKITLCILIN
ncbi:MAG: hypothetical protein ACI88A_004917 [Paraglaciecola sp.]|jgi:hypothetical protein